VIAHLGLAHHFGQRLAKRGRGGIVLVSAVAAAGGLPYMANDSATKAYPLNLGEALHVELREAGVHVSVLCQYSLTPLSSPASVSTRCGCQPRPSRPSSPSTRRSPRSWKIRRPLSPAHMSEAFQGMKAAVVEMIQARLAASQPAH
jgi:NAD(P)-dependent dehydrogenase (short-subunit alcohol dehydrogenase family)